MLYYPRRDALHKGFGYVSVLAMAFLAVVAFAIPSHFTPFGFYPLHVFAGLTLWSLWAGVRYARRRNFKAHEAVFRSLYSNGLIIAYTFTFLPSCTMSRIAFGEPSQIGWLVIAGVLSIVAIHPCPGPTL